MRKRFTLCVVLLLLISLLPGCSTIADPSGESVPTSFDIGFWHGCGYPGPKEYDIFGYLVYEADMIFVGTVKDIAFEAYLDAPDRNEIRTLYTIEITKYYKGTGNGTETLTIYGGKPGYQEYEQQKLAWENGIGMIYYYSESVDVQLGESYAFILKRGIEERLLPMNETQFAFNVNDTRSAEETDEFCYEDFKDHFKIRD